MATIDSEREWREFEAASAEFRPFRWANSGQSWISARYDGGWKWTGGPITNSFRMVDTNRFVSGEAAGWRDGRVFAAVKDGKLSHQLADGVKLVNATLFDEFFL